MDFNELIKKRDFVCNNINTIDKNILENYESSFDVDFTHNSTAIEGNTLTLMETKLLIEDKLSIGSKDLREVYEVINHHKAWEYIKSCIKQKKDLNENIIKDIHSQIMENITVGGIYRTTDVMITGAKHTPPSPNKAYYDLQAFYETLTDHNYNEFEIAAYTHAEFVKIHPFIDGNGRVSRLIMNYQLLRNGFLPISIKKEDRFSYYDTLDEYAVNNNLTPFLKLIFELEEKQLDLYIKAIEDSKN